MPPKREPTALQRWHAIQEIRQELRNLQVLLDAVNPALALGTGIEVIDYRLAHFDHYALSMAGGSDAQ